MEKLKGKHNHTLTNILKVFTFALVLLFPFLVFMPSALYYGFNEHAQIEIPQKIGIYQTNEVNNLNDIKINKIYHCESLKCTDDSNAELHIKILKLEEFLNDDYIIDDSNIYKFNSNDRTYLNVDYNPNNPTGTITLIDGSDTMMRYYFEQAIEFVSFEFYIDNQQNLNNFKLFYADMMTANGIELPTASDFNVYEISETTTISENLSNSWENMWRTPLFAWTNNTPFTATTNAFASVFNISQQSGIYNLLAYFITITGIYLVIDIVIGVATMLTHMISKQD